MKSAAGKRAMVAALALPHVCRRPFRRFKTMVSIALMRSTGVADGMVT
jgi:hypothetical protein